jgi:two-component system LytT family sensor kinase
MNRTIVQQLLYWAAFWTLVPVLLSGGEVVNWSYYPQRTWMIAGGIALVVWVNLKFLLPVLYFKKRTPFLYALAGILLVVLVAWGLNWEHAPWSDWFRKPNWSPEGHKPMTGFKQGMRYLSFVMPFFTSWIGSALFAIAQFATQKEKEAADYKSEKLEAEIQFLKSQINPHFLFNALNNIYTLTLLKSNQAPEQLLKLSEMLRYMLYDCKADRVPLHKEIAYLRNFISLQLLKDSRGMNVKVQLDESRPAMQLAPLLLVPFVENAFKHSRVEDLHHGWIDIKLQTKEQQLDFWVHNSLPKSVGSKDKVGGIGLKNVRRQLELLYPDRHDLQLLADGEVFSIHLQLQLKDA